MTALLPAEITSRRVVARYLNLVADGPEDPDDLPDGAVPTGDVRFTRVTDGRVWADTTQTDGTTVRIARGPIVANIDPTTGEIGLAHDPAHGVKLPVGLWSVEERVPGRPAKPWVLDVTAGEGVIDLHVQAPVVPTPTTVLVPSLETMERAEAAAAEAVAAKDDSETARDGAVAAKDLAIAARDTTLAAAVIVGVGRPDVPATLTTPDTAALVAAATSGAEFRSIDGPQGAWVWRKRGSTWVCVEGDTGWRNIATLTINGWTAASGVIYIRRHAGSVVEAMARTIDGTAASSTTFAYLPTGFRSGANGRALTTGSSGAYVAWDGEMRLTRAADVSMNSIFSTTEQWPTTLPGVAV